jgi:transaldolase
MIIAIGHDHAGHALRATVANAVEAAGHVPLLVTADSSEPTDYPDVAEAVAEAIAGGRAQRGILVCGSGAGVTVAANGHAVVRAALAHEEYTARQMVEHDDVNVVTLGARAIGPALAAAVVRSFLGAEFSGEPRHARRLAKVLDQRRARYQNALGELRSAGQSVWLDSISRRLVADGTLARYISELSVTGVTSNPSILQHAIGTGTDYDDAITAMAEAGVVDPEEIVFALAIDDLVRAADLLLPVYHASAGVDGFVSIEVSPTLVDDAAATVAAGLALFARADRPNVMIKVPGTTAGLRAVEELLFAGIPVNVTLLFSPEQYTAAAETYVRAMERRLAVGLTPSVPSVASVFVSRWDAAADPLIPLAERGKLGVALMQESFARYNDILDGPRYHRLALADARPQRLLWASTGTKNPDLADTFYLGRLAAPRTVNTVPEKTLLAYADHGVTCDLLAPDHDEARRCIGAVRAAGVDVEALAAALQADGVAGFDRAWSELLASIQHKLATKGNPWTSE